MRQPISTNTFDASKAGLKDFPKVFSFGQSHYTLAVVQWDSEDGDTIEYCIYVDQNGKRWNVMNDIGVERVVL